MSSPTSANHHRLIIIGSGPAGLTAALYAGRANLTPMVFEGIQPGGQLTITTEVDNFPGFPKGIMGPDLMELFREQALRFGAISKFEMVSRVNLAARPFEVFIEEERYTADALIIATGATAKWLNVPGEKELMGHGVSACATCDGFFFKQKELVVIGGGDTAMEEATFLTKFASKVTIVHRRDKLRASMAMQGKALHNPKIAFVWNSGIEAVHGTKKEGVTGVTLKNLLTGGLTEYPCQGYFVAIGHQPNTQLFEGQLDLDESGYLVVEPGTTRTKIPGVFAAGDVADKLYRQAITAAGSGCMAAIDAERHLGH